MKRINLIRNQLSNRGVYPSAYDNLNFDEFLTKEEVSYRKRLREYLEAHAKNRVEEFNEKTEFPWEIVRDLEKNFPGVFAPSMKGYGGPGFSPYLSMVIGMEIARIDMSLAAFWAVHGGEVVMRTIYILGSEGQKKYYLPRMHRLELIGAFCLTEPGYGSNAYGIETSAREDGEGNIIINGVKRWIGQGTIADIYIVWAKSEKSGEIVGYIVESSRPGVSSKKIEGKLAFRSVQNGQITFNSVKIPKENKLEKATNFQKSVSKVFLASRIGIGLSVAGVCMGAYDQVIEYLSNRIQFERPLTSFQLVQEKLVQMMGNIQSILYFAKRVNDLYLQGKATIGMAGICKAWCTTKGRETLALAREVMGGNGTIHIMKAFCDMEALHTVEGTYEINMLMAGKELTGEMAIIS